MASLDREVALAEIRQLFGHAGDGMDHTYDHRTIERMRRIVSLSPLLAVLSLVDAPTAASAA